MQNDSEDDGNYVRDKMDEIKITSIIARHINYVIKIV